MAKMRATSWVGMFSSKGGVGKSTLAVHLAVEAQRQRERVLVLDADPQGSALAWGSVSDEDDELRIERLADGARDAKVGDATLVIVDFPPRSSAAVGLLAGKLDFALVPIGASAFDVLTVDATARILRAAGVPFSVVLNRTPPPRVLEVAGAEAALAGMDVDVAPLTIAERRPFVRALESGLAAVEFDPSGRAAAEIHDLWTFLRARLEKNDAQSTRHARAR